MAEAVSGTFGAVGQSVTINPVYGTYNVSVSGTFVGTVEAQRSFDNGATWLAIEAFTTPIEKIGEEFERGVLVRLACTVYTSGTVTYRLGVGDYR